MIDVLSSLEEILPRQTGSGKPLGVILAGHNGSGKSTMWRKHLSPALRIPLVNADRMMLSVLPEPDDRDQLAPWARELRDTDESWMRIAQKGVEAFVAQAMLNKVAFAMETVFSHWIERPDGTVASKIDLIEQLQAAGYFVLLAFVGLTGSTLSILRVRTRVALGGHDVAVDKLRGRFRRTQMAIRAASRVADATVLFDNSRDESNAFAVCRVQLRDEEVFDLRRSEAPTPATIREWLDIVGPVGAR